MMEEKVKGSLLLDYVRMIRANKDKDWGKYLEPQDWEIINGRVLPSLWYPLSTFRRAGLATFNLLANGNMEMVRAWGRISLEQLVKGLYKSIVAEPDPVKALERFVLMRRQFYNFLSMEMKPVDDKHVKLLLAFGPEEPGHEPYRAQLQGGVERLLELTGGKNPEINFSGVEWNGASATEFDITWE